MDCFINNLFYFALFSNLSVVPNTSTTCNSKDSCVSSMCQLAHQKDVSIVCFMAGPEYQSDTNTVIPVLSCIILALFIYSMFMTGVTWYSWRTRY